MSEFELKVTSSFAAAHRLTMVSEKCENMHGHNWKIEVKVRGPKLDKAGVVADFRKIKNALRDTIETLDHKFLNELEFFSETVPPSSENIALYIADSIQAKIKDLPAKVYSVSAWESDDACATYIC